MFSQQHTLSGYVKDALTGEALIGVSIYVEKESKGATTNVYGFYSISLKSGEYEVKYSYVGYADILKTIQFKDHVRLNIDLKESQDLLWDGVVLLFVRL